MDVAPFHTIHQQQIETAFEEFDRMRKLHAVGYTAEEGITRFHCDRMVQLSQNPKSNQSVYANIYHDKIAAIMGSSTSKWHEEIYGVPYYKINPLYVFVDQHSLIQNVVSNLNQFCCTEPESVYTLRVDAQQDTMAYELSRQGFAFVGTSVRYHLGEKVLRNHPLISEKTNCSITIRQYSPDDLETIQRIARTGHRHSHFFQEPRFEKEQTQYLFSEWIKKCMGGLAEMIWVAELDGNVVGFSSCLLSNALQPYINKKIGVIDFIVVDESIQGKGIGKELLGNTLQWFHDKVDDVELRTMADNLHAVRFYEKYGFRILSSDHHFHLWT